MKIIITGATGFVGSNLSAYLEEKKYAVEKLSLKKSHWDFNRNADVIIHLAGIAHDIMNLTTIDEYFRVHRDLTILLFKEFLNSNVRDFIYFSSVKATADSVDGFLDENHYSNPKTPYGKSKLEAENYLLSQQLSENKRLFIIRPCMIHGPGNKGNLNLLYKVVKKGIPWPLADFDNQRSFLSIDNLNFLIERIISDQNMASGVYNFSDDKALSSNDLVKIIANTSGKTERLLKIPKHLISFVAKTGDYLKLPLNSERLKKLTENYIVSNQKIKTALNIDSLPITAEEGMKKTIESFILDKK